MQRGQTSPLRSNGEGDRPAPAGWWRGPAAAPQDRRSCDQGMAPPPLGFAAERVGCGNDCFPAHCGTLEHQVISTKVFTRDTMFGPLLAADPSFRGRWEAFVAEWADEGDLPLYLALGSLAEHLLERLARGDTEGFDRIFTVVEQWHTQGDTYVSEAASRAAGVVAEPTRRKAKGLSAA